VGVFIFCVCSDAVFPARDEVGCEYCFIILVYSLLEKGTSFNLK